MLNHFVTHLPIQRDGRTVVNYIALCASAIINNQIITEEQTTRNGFGFLFPDDGQTQNSRC